VGSRFVAYFSRYLIHSSATTFIMFTCASHRRDRAGWYGTVKRSHSRGQTFLTEDSRYALMDRRSDVLEGEIDVCILHSSGICHASMCVDFFSECCEANVA
jgi:hypothetical protein